MAQLLCEIELSHYKGRDSRRPYHDLGLTQVQDGQAMLPGPISA